MSWPEEGKTTTEHRMCRREPIIDSGIVQLLEAGELTRPTDVDVYRCHDSPRPMDGEDSQPNRRDPAG
jgi:hypothetical protein